MNFNTAYEMNETKLKVNGKDKMRKIMLNMFK